MRHSLLRGYVQLSCHTHASDSANALCAAPEVLAATGYDKEVDLWSVGVITYLLYARHCLLDMLTN